ncbi:uncharacterized protein BO66DRAFT_434470, partial [Aspergillus aculeatinus CBS 121060]
SELDLHHDAAQEKDHSSNFNVYENHNSGVNEHEHHVDDYDYSSYDNTSKGASGSTQDHAAGQVNNNFHVENN